MLNTPVTVVPTACTAPMITIAMNVAMSAYSIAVTPDSSYTKPVENLNMLLVLLDVAR